MASEAYTAWVPLHGYDPRVNLISALNAAAIAGFIILLSFERLSRLKKAAAALIAVLHALYIAAYTRAYSMKVTIVPLFDVLRDGQGHASLVLDFTQLMLLYIAATLLLERKRKANKPPEPPAPLHGDTAGAR